jgi:ribosomal protein L5
MPKIQHFAFKIDYPNIASRLATEASIFDISTGTEQNGIKVTALWDTGAMRSAVTHSISKRLNLVPFDRVKVNGINNTSMADVARISIGLPNMVMIKEVNVMICNLVKDIDLLIGMDIIQIGDFSISNGEGKTLFSFVIPPFEEKIDLYDKAVATNKKT